MATQVEEKFRAYIERAIEDMRGIRCDAEERTAGLRLARRLISDELVESEDALVRSTERKRRRQQNRDSDGLGMAGGSGREDR